MREKLGDVQIGFDGRVLYLLMLVGNISDKGKLEEKLQHFSSGKE